MKDKVCYELAHIVEKNLSSEIEGFKCSTADVLKNNGVYVTQIQGRIETSGIAPSVTVDDYIDAIEEGRISIEDAANSITESIKVHLDDVKIPVINNATAKNNLFLSVINKECNQELLKSALCQDLDNDLALVTRFNCYSKDDGIASFVFKSEMLPTIEMTESEALEIAYQNTVNMEYSVRNIASVIAEQLGYKDEDIAAMFGADDLPMYVVTTKNSINGAVGLFISEDLRKKVYDTIGCDDGYYVLPSSVDELIAVPNIFEPEQLKEMVKEVNGTVVEASKYLSDNVYFCDKDLKLSIADEISDEIVFDDAVDCSIGLHL